MLTITKASGIKKYEIADQVSFKSAMVSHYCVGRKPLNAEAIIEFCNVLQRQPREIDPERKIFKLNISSRDGLESMLDRLSAENLEVIHRLVSELAEKSAK